jgi:epoxyqueuosine reductase
MNYILRRESAYEHPQAVLASVRSVIMLGVNYHAGPAADDTPAAGRVAKYAQADADYHDVLRGMLKQLADFLHAQRPGCRTRGVVDTAPLLERDFARLAGLGWFGKNTMLIHKRAGSWLFLAGLLTDLALEPDAPHATSHCGTCTRCLEACPTDAFPEPYVLDARRCISYLTIELRDRPIPVELREPMGDWLFGCDVCQDVCPWNRKAPATTNPALQPRPDLVSPDPIELLGLSSEEFELRFGRTPLARPSRSGVLRNAAIVVGNTATSGDARAIAALGVALSDGDPLIRGAAAWGLGKLGGGPARQLLSERRDVETNPVVLGEIAAGLGPG